MEMGLRKLTLCLFTPSSYRPSYRHSFVIPAKTVPTPSLRRNPQSRLFFSHSDESRNLEKDYWMPPYQVRGRLIRSGMTYWLG